MIKPLSTIALVIGFGFTTVAAISGTVDRLTESSIEQCETQDWPVDKRQAHVAYCLVYHGIDLR